MRCCGKKLDIRALNKSYSTYRYFIKLVSLRLYLNIGDTDKMNAIITVIGHDRVGIIASVCNLLADYNINVLEISQTILRGNFTMIMTVDIEKASASLEDIGTALEALGRNMNLTIRIQREDLFDAMYNI